MMTHVVKVHANDLICPLCMDYFMCPVIASDGSIYCDDCITEWSKTNIKSPGDKTKKITWVKCNLFNEQYKQIYPKRVIEFDDIANDLLIICTDKNNALYFLQLIDKQNNTRLIIKKI
jgi:hypothetical protein